MKKRLSPFWMMFGFRLCKLFCDHSGVNGGWNYRHGTGIVEQYCDRCGKVIKRVFIDDLPKDHLDGIIKLIHEQKEDPDEED